MSKVVVDQLETTLHSVDPLSSLSPAAREALLCIPQIAWPTVLLFFANILAMTLIVALCELKLISYFAACVMMTCTMFAMFTVGHDAAHGAISQRFKFLNEVIGRISFGCMGPFGVFGTWKVLHHMHHKFTNHPSKDPDRFFSEAPLHIAPIRCLLTPVHYLYFYSRIASTRPWWEVTELLIQVIFNVWVIFELYMKGYTMQLVSYWIVPAIVGYGLLTFFFDYLPHHSLTATPIESRYHTTSMLQTYSFIQPIFTFLLQYQDYHLIHHLYPTIPFYRYADKWQEKQEFLLTKNVPIHNLVLPATD